MNKSLSLRMASNLFLRDLISCTLMNSIPLKEVAEEAVEVDSLEGSPAVCLASHLWVVHQEVSLGQPVEEADAEQIPSQVLVCE